MIDDLVRHRLLGILSEQYTISGVNKSEDLGISYEEILEKLKITQLDLNRITAELFVNKEVALQNVKGPLGLYSGETGIIAFTTKKYKKRYYDQFITFGRNISQILVPILSLTVAILAIIWKIDSNSENNNKLETLERKIMVLETKVKAEKEKKVKIEKEKQP